VSYSQKNFSGKECIDVSHQTSAARKTGAAATGQARVATAREQTGPAPAARQVDTDPAAAEAELNQRWPHGETTAQPSKVGQINP
jgi:hypothetical protein